MRYFNCRENSIGNGFAEKLDKPINIDRKGNTAILLVHGYKASVENVNDAYEQVENGLGVTDVYGFHWPSNNRIMAYWSDRKDAKKAAGFLAEAIQSLRHAGYKDIAVIAHSMGNRVVGELLAITEPPFDPSIVVTYFRPTIWIAHGADVACRKMGVEGDYGKRQSLVKAMYNLYSPKDRVLGFIAPAALPSKRLGRCGLPDDKPKNFYDLDVCALTGEEIRHGDYKKNKKILVETRELILGVD